MPNDPYTAGDVFLGSDHRQRRQIQELQAGLDVAYADAAFRSRAFQTKISQVQGTLEKRLDRLATAFDAFVELSDLRMEMLAFGRESMIRYRAHRLVASFSQDVPTRMPECEDIPGYWLGPAADGLDALVRGDGAAAERAIAEATGRDEARTALFLSLALPLAGRAVEAGRWLETAFGPIGTSVSHAQRALWTACAGGVFGEPGRLLVARRLAEYVAGLSPEESDAERRRWWQMVPSTKGRVERLPRVLSGIDELTGPLNRCAQLYGLRNRLEDAAETPAAEPEPLERFGELLDSLIDEGSVDDAPLLRRAAELRAIIEPDEARPRWNATEEKALDLLFQDALAGDGSALHAGGRWLTSIATDLARGATERPPGEVTTRINGYPVRLRPDRPATLTDAEADIERAHSLGDTPERMALLVAALGALVTILGIVVGQVALIVLGALALVVGATVWPIKRRARLRAARWTVEEKRRLNDKVEEAAKALIDYWVRREKRLADIAVARDAVAALPAEIH